MCSHDIGHSTPTHASPSGVAEGPLVAKWHSPSGGGWTPLVVVCDTPLVGNNNYRGKRKQVNALVSLALYANMKKAAGDQSLQQWMVEAFREKVDGHGDRVDDPADAAVDAVERADLNTATGDRGDIAGGTVGDAGEQRIAVSLTDYGFPFLPRSPVLESILNPTPRWGELADKDLDPFGTLTVKESA